ncbi:hypothetical protein [Ulvibacterium marinum]|uniref:hypothetical protein n=1 Tax=Ulvibacterium marinum TaxID=2419782 RepID=UPI002494F68A|nr:hypothetical protein [Ulvibacterium marinum]
MKARIKFSDPKGKYIIGISDSWTYNNDESNSKRGLHQFEVSQDCVFQISCRPIDEHILKIIDKNRIIAHDFNLPNVSYLEKYEAQKNMHSYIWMCQIEDYFILAIYFYNPSTKPQKETGLDLMDVRMCLQQLQFIKKEPDVNSKNIQDDVKEKDYLDIESWREYPTKFFDFMLKKDKDEAQRISSLNIDAVKLYSLLKSKVSQKPNGFYDWVRVGLPLDSMIWWDFIMACDKGFIQVYRTAHVIEAIYEVEEPFDLLAFFKENIKKYSKEVSETIQTFDKHTLYINHYKSYEECVNTLWKEIEGIDLTIPKGPERHVSEKKQDLKKYKDDIIKFSQNSIKYHALAKSLVLNAAFKMESFLNLIIRIGSTPEVKMHPDILSKFLRNDFTYRIKNLRFYTWILKDDFDIGSSVYREAKELMNLRNKYVHSDEDSMHNRLGEVFYDGDYPLHRIEESRPAIQSIIKMYHTPELEKVRKAKEASEKFVKYILRLINQEVRSDLIFLINQNPIGYNETSGMYSSVFNPSSVDFFASMEKNNSEEE